MTDEQYTALVKAVLGYAALKISYTLKGVTVEEGDVMNAALAACQPEGYNARRAS